MTKIVEIRLLELMGRNNIRQIKQLSRLTNLNERVLSDIVNGKKKGLRLDTIATLCEVLDCRVDELLVIKEVEDAS